MKGQFADRKCPICQTTIAGNEKICPACKIQVGRENIDLEFPGSYKGYIKSKRLNF